MACPSAFKNCKSSTSTKAIQRMGQACEGAGALNIESIVAKKQANAADCNQVFSSNV